MRAIVAAAVVPPLLESISFKRLERILSRAALSLSPPAHVPLDSDAAWWVDRALGRLPAPWKHTCLRRASVLYFLLRNAGREVELCIGVRRDETGELLAHAWLLHHDALYLEPPANLPTTPSYKVIARFPRDVEGASA